MAETEAADRTQAAGSPPIAGIDGWPPPTASRSPRIAPNLHARVGVAVPNLRHVEYFHDHQRIERRLFDGALGPCGGCLAPDSAEPGLGLRLRVGDAQPFRKN
jgi:hypothetical protein